MLDQDSPYVQLCQQVRQRIKNYPAVADIEIRLMSLRSNDHRRNNTPAADEVGAIMVGDGHDGSISDRDIIVKLRSGKLQRISALHSTYTPLNYTLLFPDGR